MSTIGLIHTVFGVVALLSGTAVVLIRKGTRWHRTLGHIYFTNMLALNISALFIYRLFDGFGPFHGLAISSLVTLVAAMIPVFLRRPRGRWVEVHGIFMNFSFVGLVAATFAEITSRIPGTEDYFGIVVALTSIAIWIVGGILIFRYTPLSVQRAPKRFRRSLQA